MSETTCGGEVPHLKPSQFVHLEPTFKSISNVMELQLALRELHRPIMFPEHSREPANQSVSQNPMEPFSAIQSHSGAPQAPRVLCLWDIDDTLVSSGEDGVRRHLMFEEHDLRRIFRAMPETRHLLLSQGSTDDVMMDSGRLAFLRNFFLCEEKRENDSEDFDESDDEGGIFSCCTSETKREKEREMILDQASIPIHLTRIEGMRKEVSCHAWNNWKPTDNEGNNVRWLILRPGMWGISLARLSSLIPPTRRTAFVDGKHFRKLDIVWSLAASGNWDRVFFIDNNLCEVGIIKYGMSYSTAFSTLERRRADKVFLSDFALLKASAKLYKIEKQKGERVTYAEEEGSTDVVSSPFVKMDTDFPSASPKSGEPQEVELVIANLHFNLLDYYRVGHSAGYGNPELMALSRQSGHPTFFEDQCCTDSEYNDFLSAFLQAENAIDQIIVEDLRVDGVVGNGWKRGWKPNSNKVVLPLCSSKIQIEEVRRVCTPMYRSFIMCVCKYLEQAHSASERALKNEYFSMARKEAYAIYLDLWRNCPIIDAAFVVDFGTLLYKIHISDNIPSKGKVKKMKKKAEDYLAKHDPNNTTHLVAG